MHCNAFNALHCDDMILFSEAVGLQVYSIGLPNRDAVEVLHFHFPIKVLLNVFRNSKNILWPNFDRNCLIYFSRNVLLGGGAGGSLQLKDLGKTLRFLIKKKFFCGNDFDPICQAPCAMTVLL